MRLKSVVIPMACVLGIAVLAAAVTRDTRSTSTSCATIQSSEVCTWVVMDHGEAVELGATIPLALVESVPEDVEMVWPPEELGAVALPVEARESLGIDHLGVNWEAHGHPPTSFLTQHFDFHFYNITQAEVRGIDCADGSKPATLPTRYALPDIEVPGLGMLEGLCVPHMGMHAMPVEDVHESDAFDASMMLGFYKGEPIFFEPMVSRELLLAKSDFSLAMPTIEGLPAGVRYPSEFLAVYDEAEAQYRLIFSGFYPG